LHGGVQARTRTAGTEQVISGREAVGWVDRIIALPVDELVLHAANASVAAAPDPRLDLTAGTVPGAGVALRERPGRSEVTDRSAETPAEGDADEAESAGGIEDPVPVSAVPVVEGIVCENDHFNHPLARFCSLCGQGMFDRTPVHVQRERPPLGALILDTGVTMALDSDLLVGSDLGDRAEGPDVRLLEMSDDAGSIAPQHAEVRLRSWDVNIVDRGTPQGTYVWLPGATHWQRLEPEVPTTIPSGTRVAVGKRTFTYTSNHQ
jgi:hypothetical protein